ncbi:hypothetical protein [Schlesneria paludicola]|uniref:hypothetical protein n=1 Tax=Schlesneria paludicola TaxID=360056 RepID=UPI0012F984A9|nr:hypothetical protein [Schlesneria paludicola]
MFGTRSLLMILSCNVLLCSSFGCATFHSPFEKRLPKATAANPAVQIIGLWQHADGNDPDGRPCKGFSGQILFLSNGSPVPLKVDGDVRIYLFDDQGTLEEQAKPLRVFEFDSGSWDVHLAQSTLGLTYTVFIPYTRRGVNDANCSLRIRLKPKQGPTVFSDFSNMPLNGNKKPQRGDDAKPFSDEELKKIATDAMTGELRRTTTISTGPNPQTIESTAGSKAAPPPNPIQLASHQTTEQPPATSTDSDRVKRLEAMVQQLLEQKASAAASSATAPIVAAPAELNAEQASPANNALHSRQIRMRRRDERPAAPASRRGHPLDDDDMESTGMRTNRRSVDAEAFSGHQGTEPDRLSANSADETEPYRRTAR